MDLAGEFAGRGEHQDGRSRTLFALQAVQTLQHGQRERAGLAGAGLGLAEHIATGEDMRNGFDLDG